MEIILIRHSIAEEKRKDLEDSRRQLTDDGKDQFQKLMPELEEKLAPLEERNTVLWSSPATRALETAHIVTKAISIDIGSVQDFIYTGDFKSFSAGVKNISETATLFVVGHQPSLGEWAKQMTGKELRIEKGAILSFKVLNQSPVEAELQWKITP